MGITSAVSRALQIIGFILNELKYFLIGWTNGGKIKAFCSVIRLRSPGAVTNYFVILQTVICLWFTNQTRSFSWDNIVTRRNYTWIVTAQLDHDELRHLGASVLLLIWLGKPLERSLGHLKYFVGLITLIILSGMVDLGLKYLLAKFLGDTHYLRAESIGFSGVIVAMLVINCWYFPQRIKHQPYAQTRLHPLWWAGMEVVSEYFLYYLIQLCVRRVIKYAKDAPEWILEFMESLVNQNPDFLAHIGGFLAGFLCVGVLALWRASGVWRALGNLHTLTSASASNRNGVNGNQNGHEIHGHLE